MGWIHAAVSEKPEVTDDGRTADACAMTVSLLTKSSRAKIWKTKRYLTLWQMGKWIWQIPCKWLIVEQNKVKFGTRGNSGTYTFDLMVLKVIWVIWFVYFFSEKTAALSTLMIFSTNLFVAVPCDSPHKGYFLEFWKLELKKMKRDWKLTL